MLGQATGEITLWTQNAYCNLILSEIYQLASIHLHSDMHMFLQLSCKAEMEYNAYTVNCIDTLLLLPGSAGIIIYLCSVQPALIRKTAMWVDYEGSLM